MKVLILTSRFPFPPIGGDKLRIFYIIKHFSRTHDVTLFSIYEKNSEIENKGAIENYVKKLSLVKINKIASYISSFIGLFSKKPLQCYYYYSKKARIKIEHELNHGKYDLIFVHLIRMAEYVRGYSGCNKYLDLTDAISLNYQRAKLYRTGIFKWINLVEFYKVQRYETEISKDFDRTFVISSVDKNYIELISNRHDIEILQNGVDLDYFYPNYKKVDEKIIIFLGNLRTFPNQDAVSYFAYDIFPYIRNKHPDIFFYVVGIYPSNKIIKLNSEKNIKVIGYVEDVREYIWSAMVSVCPVRVGAGVQNKILECMSCGLPVITTQIGNEGIDGTHSKDLFVAEQPKDYLKYIELLLNHPEKRKMVSINARKFIENKYKWEVFLQVLDK